jgi:hypothetical protein
MARVFAWIGDLREVIRRFLANLLPEPENVRATGGARLFHGILSIPLCFMGQQEIEDDSGAVLNEWVFGSEMLNSLVVHAINIKQDGAIRGQEPGLMVNS